MNELQKFIEVGLNIFEISASELLLDLQYATRLPGVSLRPGDSTSIVRYAMNFNKS